LKPLVEEFRRIAGVHAKATKARFARAVLGSSVIRVFAKGTKPGLQDVLMGLPTEELGGLRSQAEFNRWYRRQLARVAREVRRRNKGNDRVQPGLKWGHSAKVLSLYLRDLVLHTRLFSERQAKRIAAWLYVPIDGVVIRRMSKLGVPLPFDQIQEIATAKVFDDAQSILAIAARKARVPRVWFDDNWADRQ